MHVIAECQIATDIIISSLSQSTARALLPPVHQAAAGPDAGLPAAGDAAHAAGGAGPADQDPGPGSCAALPAESH